MSWVVGAGLGLLLGGPLGAIIGGALQHAVTKNENRGSFENSGTANKEAHFVSHLVAIMTKIAMADGNIAKSEVAVIHNFFAGELKYSGFELRFVDALINQTSRANPDLGAVARSFLQGNNHETALLLLDLCYKVAAADGHISLQEQHELGYLSESLRISSEEHERIKYKYSGFEGGGYHSTSETMHSPAADDYAVLGITPAATDADVKKAYRQMAAQYHPDKVAHLGGELVDFAKEKFQKINEAYKNIQKSRGL